MYMRDNLELRAWVRCVFTLAQPLTWGQPAPVGFGMAELLAAPLEKSEIEELKALFPDFQGEVPEERLWGGVGGVGGGGWGVDVRSDVFFV